MPETTAPADLLTGIQRRDNLGTLTVRESGKDAREVAGIGVPYNQPIEFWGIREQFAPGSVEVAEDAMLFWRHRDPIGKVIDHHEDETGWHHRSSISATPTGDEAYTLTRDGVIGRFSIGFEPVEHLETKDEDGTITITHTKVLVREVSLVPMPAYDGARLTEVRHRPTRPDTRQEESPTMPATETIDPAEVTDIRAGLEEVRRSLELIRDNHDRDEPAPTETRSAGQLLQAALVDQDESARAALTRVQERAYDGGTTADSIVQDAWVGDLTRIVDEAAGIRALFATGTLPAKGMNIEYGQLKIDTSKVEEQAAEGDDLAFGKVELETKTAPVKTYGGYTRLSAQEIERSSVNILDTALRAQAIAAGKAQNAAFRAHYASAVSAQRTANNTVDVPGSDASYTDWLNAVVDAAIKYEDLGVSLDGLIVDPSIFKELLAFTGDDDRPLFVVSGSGTNVVGSLDVTTLKGDLASLPVRLNAKQSTAGAAFYNKTAIRSYESGLARLQDENVINLSKDFSVYRYAALADEFPAAIVPVKRTTTGG